MCRVLAKWSVGWQNSNDALRPPNDDRQRLFQPPVTLSADPQIAAISLTAPRFPLSSNQIKPTDPIRSSSRAAPRPHSSPTSGCSGGASTSSSSTSPGASACRSRVRIWSLCVCVCVCVYLFVCVCECVSARAAEFGRRGSAAPARQQHTNHHHTPHLHHTYQQQQHHHHHIHNNLTTTEVQVHWTEMAGSKIRATSVLHMAWELATLKVRAGRVG